MLFPDPNHKSAEEMSSSLYAYPSATYPSASASAPSKPSPGGQVHYEIETSGGKPGVVVYEVYEVYVYIPAELSAAGFELKIGGVVRITDKVQHDGCGYSMEISGRIVSIQWLLKFVKLTLTTILFTCDNNLL